MLKKLKFRARVFAQVKAACKHVVEINPRCQFHQHFMCAFFPDILVPNLTKLKHLAL